ncbi:MAG: hypothetical protein OXK17_03600, partial [Thaumarchaeota archaeon]|nr:hypothetical protein [Nitrososphaerota archaeon]
MICGVDESGVGSIIGPMVFAGVAMHAESSRTLRRWGVADSKTLPCSAVSAIYKRIASAILFPNSPRDACRVPVGTR